jgi:hypothetical protein
VMFTWSLVLGPWPLAFGLWFDLWTTTVSTGSRYRQLNFEILVAKIKGQRAKRSKGQRPKTFTSLTP